MSIYVFMYCFLVCRHSNKDWFLRTDTPKKITFKFGSSLLHSIMKNIGSILVVKWKPRIWKPCITGTRYFYWIISKSCRLYYIMISKYLDWTPNTIFFHFDAFHFEIIVLPKNQEKNVLQKLSKQNLALTALSLGVKNEKMVTTTINATSLCSRIITTLTRGNKYRIMKLPCKVWRSLKKGFH